METNYTREFGRSPTFNYKNAQILTSATQLFSFDDLTPTCKKYLPFNFLKIINNSGYDIEVYINQDTSDVTTVTAGTIVSLSENDLPAVRSIIVKNISASTIDANKIKIEVRKNDVGSDQYSNIIFRETVHYSSKKDLI